MQHATMNDATCTACRSNARRCNARRCNARRCNPHLSDVHRVQHTARADANVHPARNKGTACTLRAPGRYVASALYMPRNMFPPSNAPPTHSRRRAQRHRARTRRERAAVEHCAPEWVLPLPNDCKRVLTYAPFRRRATQRTTYAMHCSTPALHRARLPSAWHAQHMARTGARNM